MSGDLCRRRSDGVPDDKRMRKVQGRGNFYGKVTSFVLASNKEDYVKLFDAEFAWPNYFPFNIYQRRMK